MDFEPRIIRLLVSGAVIILLIITVILALNQGPHVAGKRNIIFDKNVIPALENISKLVPNDEKIIILNAVPIVEYFTGRDAGTSRGITSYSSLVKTMEENNYNYLLVFENESNVPALLTVFKKKNLSHLSDNFTEIGTFITDFHKLHLYKRVEFSK